MRLLKRAIVARLLLTLLTAFSALAVPALAGAAESEPAKAVLSAANKTSTATIYETTAKLTLEGLSADQAEQFEAEPGKPLTLIDMSSRFNGEDVYAMIHFAKAMGGGLFPERGLETMIIDERFYIHGPAPTFGAPEDRWYFSDDAPLFSSTTYDSRALVRSLMDVDLGSIKRVRDQQLGGVKCTVYGAANKRAAAQALGGLLGGGTGAFDSSRILNPELNIYTCDDGYIHGMDVAFGYDCTCDDGTVKGSVPEETRVAFRAAPRSAAAVVTYRVVARFSSFGGPVKIEVPRNALPIQEPSYEDLENESSSDTTARVFNGGNIRAEPSMRGEVLGQLHAGETVELIERTADGRWYRVAAPEAIGWVSASLLTLPSGAQQRVPVQGQAGATPPASGSQAPPSGGISVKVYNGGNLRSTPNLRGQVLDQIHAGESVSASERTKDSWVRITNPRGVTGWVHRSLLTIDQATFSKIPLAK
jgi:SH3-like domain-containing protein